MERSRWQSLTLTYNVNASIGTGFVQGQYPDSLGTGVIMRQMSSSHERRH